MPHLLIVEDDDLLRDALTAQLQQAGHSTTTAADGLAARGLLESTRFDGVILDLGLPLLDGMDVLRWIRQRLLALPVLVLTARDGIDDRVQGLNAGADDYLTKPFIMAELQARLDAMLRTAADGFPGMVKLDTDGLTILHEGKPLTRMIARAFDAYDQTKAQHSAAI